MIGLLAAGIMSIQSQSEIHRWCEYLRWHQYWSGHESRRHSAHRPLAAVQRETSVQVWYICPGGVRGARTDNVILRCRLGLHHIDDFAIMPFGFTFKQWQPLAIA